MSTAFQRVFIVLTYFIFLLMLTTTGAYATVTEPGFYVGIQAGEEEPDYDQSDLFNIFAPKDFKFKNSNINFFPTVSGFKGVIDQKKFTGRLFVGYNVYKYFGWEFGVFGMPPTEIKNKSAGTEVEWEIYQATADLSGKLMLPMGRLGIYVKGGLGVSTVQHKIKVNTSMVMGVPPSFSDKKSETKFTPVMGVGVTFKITETVVIGIFMDDIKGSGDINDVKFAGVIVSYHALRSRGFCGEFLC